MNGYYYYIYGIGSMLFTWFFPVSIFCIPACVLRFIFKKLYSRPVSLSIAAVVAVTSWIVMGHYEYTYERVFSVQVIANVTYFLLAKGYDLI